MKKLQNFFWISLGIVSVGFFIYKVAKRAITDRILDNNAAHTQAVIINERNYEPNQPVKARFSYSYKFEINNEQYTGNSHDELLNIGDTVEIEYSKNNPNFNRPLHPKD